MAHNLDLKKILEEQVRPAVKNALGVIDHKPQPATKPKAHTNKPVMLEAINVIPRSFTLKTEKLSGATKAAHEDLHKGYSEAFNKTSSALDAAARDESKSNASAFRSLKDDETYNLNAIKLHELYFANISDVASEITMDSLPYMRLARDFGTFEKWQFDFMACAMAARNGWAVTVFDPYKNVFMNCVIDGHNVNIPLFTIPIIVLDMFEHAYYKDYVNDKKSYIINMMRELNWDIIEARINALDGCKLDTIYRMVPEHNPAPQAMATAANVAPIEPEAPQPAASSSANIPPGPMQPTTPPAPAMTPPSTTNRV